MEYLSGQSGGRLKVAQKYDIPESTLQKWIIKYQSGGFDNLSKKLKNNKCKCQPKNGPQLLSKSGPHIAKKLTTYSFPLGERRFTYISYII